MSRIKQALEILSQEAATLAPEVRQMLERLTSEARLLIQPASDPLDDISKLLAELRREAGVMHDEAVSAVKNGAEVVKDEAAEVLAALTQMFEDQGLEVRAQVFEKEEGETDEAFHARVHSEIAAFESGFFAEEEAPSLTAMTKEQLIQYIEELEKDVVEQDQLLAEGASIVEQANAKISAMRDAQEATNARCTHLHSAVERALEAVNGFDVKLAREILEAAK